MAELAIAGVTKRFRAVTAVEDLAITIGDGEFFVLLGPTGAGKTTTLRVVAGLETPDAGSVRIGGRDVTALSPAERDVAFVFQQYSLYPHYTVYDNMAFPLRSPARRLPERDVKRRVVEIARILRLEHKLQNKATQLSGGEMQRVSLGRALVRAPAAFLMDEPLSSLDAKLREELRIELKHIQRDLGATLLYVTHDQVEAMTLADRIGVLRQGRLVQTGSPHEIYTAPDSTFVAQQLGSPQINLLPIATLPLAGAPPGAATVGVRPENVALGPGGRRARIVAVERLGAEDVVLLDLAGEPVRALLPGPTPHAPGDEIGIDIAADSALYFDAAGGRLSRVPAASSKQERIRHAV
jgi:multiple sugar transport system ATP-binding protein